MSLTREHIIAGVRDGCWSHSSGQDILDLWDRMKDAEGRAEKAERERDDLRQEYHELFELNRRNFADLLASQAREQEWREIARVLQVEGVECLGRPDRCDKLARCGFCLLCDALARPSDTSALRELMLKVAIATHEAENRADSLPTIVDAVLGAPTSLERK